MMSRLRAVLGVFVLAAVSLLLGALPASAAKPAPHTLIQGSGSSWSSNAVQQWISDVQSRGLQVSFTPNGSASGRQDYANYIDDFAVSDIGYQGSDSTTGQADTSNGRSYAYLPIVAGGTSIPYQIKVAGKEITTLRLSGETLAKIFTGQITNWNDAAVKKDNPGLALPDLQIIPVVHSEGSGSTYQFTRYLATQYPSIWKTISNVGATEYFPQTTGATVRESGSDSMMNFVTSAAANGAIGYDEYSYPLGKGAPVAKLLNTGGYYTLPNQYNVAVALTKAQINTDKSSPNYLLQNLDHVYTYSDPRVYPMSSYSYAIIPTASNDKKLTLAKRQTIADYLDYSVCQGQAEMGHVGYSPLPINLVEASFAQVTKLHSADKGVDISQAKITQCHNPTFIAGHPSQNYLAKVAPQPEPCDKQGHVECTDSGNTGQLNPDQGGAKTSSGGNPGGGGSPAGTTNTGNASGGGASPGNGTASSAGDNTGSGTGSVTVGSANTGGGNTAGGAPANNAPSIDPNTGQQVQNTANGTGAQAVGQATVLPSSQSLSADVALGILAGAVLLALLVVPPIVASRLNRRDPS